MGLHNLAYTVYKEIKQHRNKKILSLYQYSCSILFDKWVLLYSLPLAFLGVLFIRHIMMQYVCSLSYSSNDFYTANVVLFILIMWVRFLTSSISCTYKLTVSDYMLQYMPLQLSRYVTYMILHTQFKRLAFFCLLPFLLFISNVLSLQNGMLVLLNFLISDCLFGLIQWMVFQKKWKHRFIWFTVWLLIPIVFIWIGKSGLFPIMYDYSFPILMVLLGIGSLLYVGLFQSDWLHDVDWQRVVHFGENKTYNLFLVKLITGNFSSYKKRAWIPTNEVRAIKKIPYSVEKLLHHFFKKKLWQKKGSVFSLLSNCIALSMLLNGIHFSSFIAFIGSSFLFLATVRLIYVELINEPFMQTIPIHLKTISTVFVNKTIPFILFVHLPQFYFLFNQYGVVLSIVISMIQFISVLMIYKRLIYLSSKKVLRTKG